MANNKEKNISITLDVKDVAEKIGEVCLECYGVVGLSNGNIKTLKVLTKENLSEGVFIKKDKDHFIIDIHLICAYGVKVTEIVNEVSKRIFYILRKKYGELFSKVNVYVDDLREF
ncbi:MAG: Asp23/Gls24 family envelope stress response protein [bacterium]|nr:Asp23/Gls24 family envelope stress response protein [bacterium]